MIVRHHVSSWSKERDLNQILVPLLVPFLPLWINTEATVREASEGFPAFGFPAIPAGVQNASVHVCFGGPGGKGQYFRMGKMQDYPNQPKGTRFQVFEPNATPPTPLANANPTNAPCDKESRGHGEFGGLPTQGTMRVSAKNVPPFAAKTLRERRKGALDYLESQGFANDGFSQPLSVTALSALALFLREGPNLIFWALVKKVRNHDLRESLEGLPYVASLPGSSF